MSPTSEQNARLTIDSALEAAGWIIQNRATMNLAASGIESSSA
jgi:type I site-specific restriction endonuclease